MGQLDGRTVLITGGNGGIGLAAGLACGAAGARIVVWGRTSRRTTMRSPTLTDAGVDAHAFVCDVSSESDVVETFAASVEAVGGRVDSVTRMRAAVVRGQRSSTPRSTPGVR